MKSGRFNCRISENKSHLSWEWERVTNIYEVPRDEFKAMIFCFFSSKGDV